MNQGMLTFPFTLENKEVVREKYKKSPIYLNTGLYNN